MLQGLRERVHVSSQQPGDSSPSRRRRQNSEDMMVTKTSLPSERRPLNNDNIDLADKPHPRGNLLYRQQQQEEDDDRNTQWRRIWMDWRLRYSLLPQSARTSLSVLLLVLLAQAMLGMYDYLFRSYGTTMRMSSDQDRIPDKSIFFAVVINTFQRPRQLAEAVRHYAGTCGRPTGVGQVFVVWAEVNVTPPSPSSFWEENLRAHAPAHDDRVAPVEIIRVARDSLNSRFLPIAHLQSTAIFMVDDDVRVDCASLHQGWLAWQFSPQAMVGYYPRLVERIPDPSSSSPTAHYVYHPWPTVFWRHRMNLVLTKAAFLHARYLELYSSDQHPEEVRAYVDRHFNCEDVAMSMLVANFTQAESGGLPAMPLYVEGRVTDRGLFNGISTGGGHMGKRSDCLTDLTTMYEKRGWSRPLDHSFDLIAASWVQHAPGFWWQSRPSNVFEWGALGLFG